MNLGSDLGERAGSDEAVMRFVDSASVCCGAHAGSPELAVRTARRCLELGLEVVEEGVRVVARARVTARTGVEMEALTAAAVAGLALVDMVKSVEPGVELERIRLLEKSGGKSGRWVRG